MSTHIPALYSLHAKKVSTWKLNLFNCSKNQNPFVRIVLEKKLNKCVFLEEEQHV